MHNKKVVWSISGGDSKFCGLASAAKVSMLHSKPDVIIGVSSGALLAPIIAVAFNDINIINKAIKISTTLDTKDVFPYRNNNPLNKHGKPTWNAILRVITGFNHLGFQDIRPLYLKLFNKKLFNQFKNSDIECLGFGCEGSNFSPSVISLSESTSLDDLIKRLEYTARIVPIVQPAEYHGKEYIDGGFISHSAFWWIKDKYKVNTLVSIYSSMYKEHIKTNKNWSKNALSVVFQCMPGMAHYLSMKDRIIEELYCQLNSINYIKIECPNDMLDNSYETDDNKLIAFAEESATIATNIWNNYIKHY